jgi:hypothetical protein
MLTLLKLSQKIGLVATVAAVFVWLVTVAIVMDIVGTALSQYSGLATVAVFGLAWWNM